MRLQTEAETSVFPRAKNPKTPKMVVFVDELPRTPTGKILKKELRSQYVEGGDRPITER